MMEFMEVVKRRRSCREFLPDPISEEVIDQLLEAGRLAPSGGDGQNWVFGVVRDQHVKEKLAVAAGEQNWIATAPLVMAYCASIKNDIKDVADDDFGLIVDHARFGADLVNYLNQYPDRRAVLKIWNNSNPLIPGQQIYLTAVSHGLSACWIGYLDTEKASQVLGLPDELVCLFLMPIGYPAKEPGEITRKPKDEIVFYDQWK